MRHNNKIKGIGRGSSHRSAMLANMACSLIEHKRINTTVAKAKALRRYVEPVITKSKVDSTHSRRVVFSILQNKEAVTELFRDVAPKISDRPGGYTRIIKTGFREGDGAELAMIELVDYNEIYGKEEKKKTRRSRRGSGAKTAAPAAKKADSPKAEVAEVVEEVKETVEEVVDTAKEVVEEVKEKVEAKVEKAAKDAPSKEEAKEEDSEESDDKKEGKE